MKQARKLWGKIAAAVLCLTLGIFSTNVYADGEVTVTVVPDKTSASVGETITYTYTIINATSNNITNLSLIDSKLGTIALPAPTLAVSGNITVTKTHLISTSDFPGPLENTATVTGIVASSNNVTVTASASASVSLTAIENENPPITKADFLKMRGVPGKGIEHAPGLQKPFNPKSKAEEHIAKKQKNGKE